MKFVRQSNLVLGLILCGVVAMMANISRGKGSVEPANTTQDINSLDRRISMLEQRFYTLESSINRLQQYVISQRPPVSQQSTSDRDVIIIRDEIQRLNLRLAEVECGVVKLDERTASASRRNSAPKSTDLCRLNPETPLRLSARP
jgi:predicted RNase H-like nuclease (RuvC/YqgF family)